MPFLLREFRSERPVFHLHGTEVESLDVLNSKMKKMKKMKVATQMHMTCSPELQITMLGRSLGLTSYELGKCGHRERPRNVPFLSVSVSYVKDRKYRVEMHKDVINGTDGNLLVVEIELISLRCRSLAKRASSLADVVLHNEDAFLLASELLPTAFQQLQSRIPMY